VTLRRPAAAGATVAVAVAALLASAQSVSVGATAPPVTAHSVIVFDSRRSGAWALYTKELCCQAKLLAGGPAQVLFAPSVSPNGRIALTAEVGGNYDIYTMARGGGPLTRITHGTSVEAFPAWSPDGTSIAFDSNRTGHWQIFVWHGGTVRQLTAGSTVSGLPAWSPDGATIAFDSDRTGHQEIFTEPAAGGPATEWTATSWVTNVQPAWSPDGSTIAFSSNRSGRFQIYLLNVQTHVITRLTDDAGNDYQPAWSPDGSTIAYTQLSGGVDRIYAIKTDGTGLIEVSLQSGELPHWLP
jgi:TolB protein